MLEYTKKEIRERASCDNCIYVCNFEKHFSCLLKVGIEDNSISKKRFTFCNRHIGKKKIKVKCKKTKSKNRIYTLKTVFKISFPFKPAPIIKDKK